MAGKLFWDEPYRDAIDTVITAVDGDALTLKETIFYAFSGGQESDQGSIAGLPVLEAELGDGGPWYRMPSNHGLYAGDAVRVAIDWERRYRLMRLHSAAEIVLQLVYRALPGVRRIGAHIAADKARLDFSWPQSLGPLLESLSHELECFVEADLAIESGYSDEAAERRYWRVPGLESVPCCGTHPRRTSEIGALRLKRDNRGRGQERIELYLEDPYRHG
ncbi:MAG TPA: alanyl-tRNA editing protein [Spirochaetaceae bacterium]|jgi:Ser-tRNA(Ala) deacylase AlaX|nr:alanyl-tRNA editing protein [Spirochaetaceae bacterium]